MKALRPLLVVGVVMVAGVALANIFSTAARFFGGLYVGPRATATATNTITASLATTVPFTNGDGGQLFAGCQDVTAALVGAKVGDACFVSFTSGTGGTFVDGGSGQLATCFVDTADVVTVRACPAGGQVQIVPRAAFPFRVRVVSNQ